MYNNRHACPCQSRLILPHPSPSAFSPISILPKRIPRSPFLPGSLRSLQHINSPCHGKVAAAALTKRCYLPPAPRHTTTSNPSQDPSRKVTVTRLDTSSIRGQCSASLPRWDAIRASQTLRILPPPISPFFPLALPRVSPLSGGKGPVQTRPRCQKPLPCRRSSASFLSFQSIKSNLCCLRSQFRADHSSPSRT